MTSRVVLHLGGILARRVPSVLLAEPDVEIGFLRGGAGSERIESISSVDGWDALAVSNISEESEPYVDEARASGIPVVVGSDLPFGYPVGDATFVVGATEGFGLAAALAIGMVGTGRQPLRARLAWTVPGRTLGAGTPVTFPEPVGALWAARDESPLDWPMVTCLAAPDHSPWLGVAVNLKLQGPNGTEEHTWGIADDAAFLRAVSMSSALLAAARGAYRPGLNSPGDPQGVYLGLARAAGLEIAAFIPE